MKRTHKKIVGLFGLVLVVVMTIFAAYLPGPGASAISTVTDTITVTVLESRPSVQILEPNSGDITSSLDGQIVVKYDNLSSYSLTVKYIKSNGTEGTQLISSSDNPDEHGEETFIFGAIGEEYGYAHYVITLSGTGVDGTPLQDSVEFDFVAVESDAKENEETGDIEVDLDYESDAPGMNDEEKVDTIVINVYDEDGNLVEGLSPIVVEAPNKSVVIPFDDPNLDLPSGNYTLVVQAYNADGVELYRENSLVVYYEKIEIPDTAVPDTEAPDTGGFFRNLNISRTDYLLTGLTIFTIVGISGAVFISRRGR